MVIVGFDPGLSGAACALLVHEMMGDDERGIELIDIIDLPTKSDNTKRQMNITALGRWLENIAPDEAWIENVQPMHGVGANSNAMAGASAFRFGMAVGSLRGALEAYSIPIRAVVPTVWKRWAGLLKQDKEASRQRALALMPVSGPFLKRKLDHNRSEALLIALYGASQKGML